MFPRKRQELRQSQRNPPSSRKTTCLSRTILLLVFASFFCYYITLVSRVKDEHGRYLIHSSKGTFSGIQRPTKKHSLIEHVHSKESGQWDSHLGDGFDPPMRDKHPDLYLGNKHESLRWARQKQMERNRKMNRQIRRAVLKKRFEKKSGGDNEGGDDSVNDEGDANDKGDDVVNEGDSDEGGKGTNSIGNKTEENRTDPKEGPKPILTDESPNADSLNHQNDTENSPVNYHIVFSTDCSAYQRWQSYLLFFHARKVHQPGKITRIASGCNEEEAEEESIWHQKFIADQISDKYAIHLTPKYSDVKDKTGKEKKYEFFNKPFGLLHWMERSADENFRFSAVDLTSDTNASTKARDDTIVILLDPDMVLTRPITRDFPLDPSLHRAEGHLTPPGGRPTRVTHGQPFAQLYGFGGQWKAQVNVVEVAKDPATPIQDVNPEDAMSHYPVGPPYLATARDFYKIAVKWADFVPRVHEQYPHLLAEMYAYSLAAAHLKLPHQVMNTLMVSDIGSNTEGWGLFDTDVEPETICGFAREKAEGNGGGLGSRGKVLTLPSTLHHCQRYMLGKEFFGKRRVPKDFFSCERPLLQPPPTNLAMLYDYWIPPPSAGYEEGGPKKPFRKDSHIPRTAFMLCYLIQAMNDAAKFYKEKNCGEPNLEESMQLWHE